MSRTAAAVSGPLNATAPNPVTNREFATTLGRVLRRPGFVPMPAFALRLALGEMADALLLSGQRVLPAKAQSLGGTLKQGPDHTPYGVLALLTDPAGADFKLRATT